MRRRRVQPAPYDQEFLLGTVMLLDSLRMTGNEDRLVVLDAGPDPRQRALRSVSV
jgi:hypothetical protein